jgi:putative phage lipoprotein
MPMITGNENNKGAFFNKRVFGVIALCLLVVVLIAGTLYFVFMHDQNGAEKSSEKEPAEITEISNDNTTTITTNQNLSIPSICSFSIERYEIAKTIMPKNPTGIYHYFEAPRGSTFIDVIMPIKNQASTATRQDGVVDGVKVLYDGEYEYICQAVVEINDGGELEQFTSLYTINPLQTMQYHMLAQLPETAAYDGKSLEVIVSVDGNEYICKLR